MREIEVSEKRKRQHNAISTLVDGTKKQRMDSHTCTDDKSIVKMKQKWKWIQPRPLIKYSSVHKIKQKWHTCENWKSSLIMDKVRKMSKSNQNILQESLSKINGLTKCLHYTKKEVGSLMEEYNMNQKQSKNTIKNTKENFLQQKSLQEQPYFLYYTQNRVTKLRLRQSKC